MNWLRKLICTITCSHVCYLEDMARRPDDQIECICNKCGTVLIADCGLHLGCSFERKPAEAKQ